tara:strand:+ start:85074 stop:86693 length:1620 start_codon:yes stop_codon:yes gene_type:complete
MDADGQDQTTRSVDKAGPVEIGTVDRTTPVSSTTEPDSTKEQRMVSASESEPAIKASDDVEQTEPDTERWKDRYESVQEQMQTVQSAQLAEILELYSRLHIELDDAARSELIVSLFEDDRLAIRLLGFSLVDRDLSSSTVFEPGVGEAAKAMLGDENPEIRSKAASLVVRLVLPDAMILLTDALHTEREPIAAEPMLAGIARWPSPESVDDVLGWFLRDDAPFGAACDAAWSLENQQLWDKEADHPKLIERLREVEPASINESGMKLIAMLGNADDLEILGSMLVSDELARRNWAANALAVTPRGVDLLVQSAGEHPGLFIAASDALIRYRATPVGLQQLVTLPHSDDQVRLDAIKRMGLAIENDRLTEAVRLAGLDHAHSVLLLRRLLNSNVQITERVSKGIVLLSEIELSQQRPNRAFEAASALDGVEIEAPDRLKVDRIRWESLILLDKMQDAFAINGAFSDWAVLLRRFPETELRPRLGVFMLEAFKESIDEQQVLVIRQIAGLTEEKAPADDSVTETAPNDDTNENSEDSVETD